MEKTKRLGMSVEEAAEELGVGRNQAYQAVKEGQIPAIRIGKRIIVPRRGLEKLLEQAGKVVAAIMAFCVGLVGAVFGFLNNLS